MIYWRGKLEPSENIWSTVWSLEKQRNHRTMHKVEPHLCISVNKSEVVNLWAASDLQVSHLAHVTFLKN